MTALALALILPLASCVSHGGFATAGLPSLDPAYPLPEHEAYAEIPLNEVQTKIVAGALALNGKTSFTVGDKSFPADCTGVVRAAYAYAGIDLARDFGLYSGNGVRRLFMTLQKAGLLYAVKYPAPGDIVFWDNTYDANGNGKADDELTHVGVVVSVEPDGSIRYLHHHYRLGAVIENMNLLNPDITLGEDGRTINAYLRMRGSPDGPGTNAAQLFRILGKGWLLTPE